MSLKTNLQKARSNIVFILGLAAASMVIIAVENSDYATLGARGSDVPGQGSWTLRIGDIPSAEEAQKICRAARELDVACIAIPPGKSASSSGSVG